MKERKIRIVQVATVPEFFWSFFKGQVEYLNDNRFDIHLVCSSGELTEELEGWPGQVHSIEILRKISPLQDLVTLGKIIKLLIRLRPAIVHAHTSKAGLIAMIASRLTFVPVCIYTIHGYRWVGLKGTGKALIKAANRLTCFLADKVFCVSRSNFQVGCNNKIFNPSKASVLCQGSINGVDSSLRFNPAVVNKRGVIRSRLGIGKNEIVFCFVGRIVRDKGVHELAAAWQMLRKEYDHVHLVMIGKIEAGDPVNDNSMQILRNDSRVHLLGFQKDVPSYFSAVDVLVLPTYREGFPVTPLEASAMELPVIASNIPGCIDAVKHEQTGLLIKPKSMESLKNAMQFFIQHPEFIKIYGKNGREFVMKNFRPEKIWEAIAGEYRRTLETDVQKKVLPMQTLKRFMDILIAYSGFIILSPILLFTAIAIYFSMGRPLLFYQLRAGKNGKSFYLIKFRTMTDGRDVNGNLLPDDKRLTRIGRLIRATSLDELPQLINIIRGEMSVVGPRPLPITYLTRYTDEQKLRHEMKPGITGWVAVNYRGKDKSWDEKFAQDVWYIKNWSITLDIKIIALTFLVMFRKFIINRTGETTSSEYTGQSI